MCVCAKMHISEHSPLFHASQDAFDVMQVLEEIMGNIPDIRTQRCVWCNIGLF